MKKPLLLSLACAAMLLSSPVSHAEDIVEFMSGVQATGTVKTIRKTEREFEFEAKVAGRTLVRTYSFAEVHAVTLNGTRHVLTEMPNQTGGVQSGTGIKRTQQQVRQLIDTVGSTPPDWYDETPLKYPDTLNLEWPLKPESKKWNGRVNVGQHLWDTIYPNTSRWKSGVKLVHQIMATHKNDPELLSRDMRVLGSAYFNLFQDYPRAAFWLEKTKEMPPVEGKIPLAECYWRLGNDEMALALMRGRDLPLQAIKLLGDMGQTDRAVALAKRYTNSSWKHMALLMGGDACRSAGRYDDAVKLYEMVLAAGNARNKEYTDRFRGRARDSIQAIRLLKKARVELVADGTYRDNSIGYNGPIEVELTVQSGKITDAQVVKHKEKQFYAALTDTPNQILEKQSVQGIDGTSGATITSVAIVNAAAKALASGAK
tara:strand:- start:426461 stop:427744 length:1284 start_codon:yes stop_codon:yes gene_type:complete